LPRQIVITVHGVNPDRQWQKAVEKVFAPHFDCKAIEYHQYNTMLGPVRAIANIPLLLFGLCLLAAATYYSVARNWVGTIDVSGVAIVVLGLSIALARAMRLRCSNDIKKMVNKMCCNERPHVVAHSLGTYLIGRALRKFPDISLANVVLVSSILPRTYPWQRLLPTRVSNVRNEFGRDDWVTKLVGWLHWLVRDLGPSGAVGFAGDATLIHSSENPLDGCPLCRTAPARVHNIRLNEFNHSTEFLGDGHARKLWLPFLWELVPAEFSYYLDMCQRATRLKEDYQLSEANVFVVSLWDGTYSWTRDRSLAGYVNDQISSHLRDRKIPGTPALIEELAEDTMTMFYITTDKACSEVSKENFWVEEVARCLYPPVAVCRTIACVINKRFSLA
jgi:pimeloyl-ACP methyl ester carboxylesterase